VQVFCLNVAKVDLVLHILQLDPFAVTACCSYWACLHARGCGGGTGDRHGKPCERKLRCSPCMARVGVGNGAGGPSREAGGTDVGASIAASMPMQGRGQA